MALQTVNEVAVSWAESEFTFDIEGAAPIKDLDLTAVTFESAIERGEQRGQGGKLKRRTTGQETPTASMTMGSQSMDTFVDALVVAAEAGGFVDSKGRAQISKVPFTLIVKHSFVNDPAIQCVKLMRCHLDKFGASHAEGTDANVIEVDLNPIEIVIVRNGKDVVLL